MPFEDWFPKIKTNMETVHTSALAADSIATLGTVYSFNEWPAAALSLPATLIGTIGGNQAYGVAAPAIAHHIIKIRTFVSLGISLAEAQAMASPFVELVRNQFAQDITLDGTVDHFLPDPPPALLYEGPGVIEYADKEYAGIIFTYDLKENESGTFTVQA